MYFLILINFNQKNQTNFLLYVYFYLIQVKINIYLMPVKILKIKFERIFF